MRRIIIVLIAICALACSGKLGEFRRTRDISEIIGTTFLLPANPRWLVLDRDTTLVLMPEPRLVVYLDGSACTPCALKELRHWKPIIRQLDGQLLFILQTSAENEIIKQTLIEQEFDFPVMCDEASDFECYNLLPTNELFHVFLLDQNNKVIQVGNPLISLKMFDVFKRNLTSLNKKLTLTIN